MFINNTDQQLRLNVKSRMKLTNFNNIEVVVVNL